MSAIAYGKKQLPWLRLREIHIYVYKHIWKIVWQHYHLANNKVYVYPNHGILTGYIDPGKNLLQYKCKKSIFSYIIVKTSLCFLFSLLLSSTGSKIFVDFSYITVIKAESAFRKTLWSSKKKKSQMFSGRYNNFTCYQHFLFTLKFIYFWA